MILYRDDDWVVVDKPEGMATHAASPGELGVAEWLELHLDTPCHIVSRLDRGTSGVLLLARNAEASARAQEIHESDQAAKIYEFISHVDAASLGYKESWVCDDAIDGKAASTRFTCLGPLGEGDGGQRSSPLFRYRARINRGRKHQIRRHAAQCRLPILGDAEYGGRPFPRLCLHCHEIMWPELPGPVHTETPGSFTCLERGDTSASRLGLALCRDRRGGWLQEITDAFRAVHRDEIAGLPASVDIYGEWFNAIWYDETADSAKAVGRLDPVLRQIMKVYGLRGGVVRNHRRNPHRDNLVGQTRTVGDEPPETFTVTEHGLRYEINLRTTQHTGLFLDQRDTRWRDHADGGGQAHGQPVQLHLLVLGGGGGRGLRGGVLGGHGQGLPGNGQDQLRPERAGRPGPRQVHPGGRPQVAGPAAALAGKGRRRLPAPGPGGVRPAGVRQLEGRGQVLGGEGVA
jgi:hypothetical protein